ncbi:MAG: Gfo/Idh/MocA family oxidoreductase [Nitrospira sp.]|nr:Gfo/Idh/MocA family oxidoreductase [Nitrospira sp.]
MLSVAVIGLGVGEQHALAYHRSGQCKIRWLYDLNDTRIDEVAARLGEGSKAESPQTIFCDAAVDLVSIASFDDMHFTQVMEALCASKHTFVEKPLCRSLEELRTIKEAWERSPSCHLMSNLVLRAAPVYRWLKEAVQTGELGEVYAFDGDYLYGRLDKITDGWRKNVKDYSVMQGGGVHLVDLMLWLTGQRPAVVTAVGNRICTKGTEFRYDDFMSATFQFPSGMIGQVTANFGCVHRHHHVVRVFGTKATFIYDDMGARLHTTREPNNPAKVLDLSPLPATKGDLIPAFVKSVLSGDDPSAQARHELNVISACVAADRAMASSQALSIEYV